MDFTQKYKRFQNQRQKALDANRPKNYQEIEKSIKKQFLKNVQNAKINDGLEYFSYDFLKNIPEIKKYFSKWFVNSARGQGKTWAMKALIEEKVRNGERFVILRSTDKTAQALGNFYQTSWFIKTGWVFAPSKGFIYSSKNAYTYRIGAEVIGFIAAVNTPDDLKSIDDFPNVTLMIWDEFNEENPIQNKFKKFTSVFSSIERKKENFIAIGQANYVEQSDPILTALGVANKDSNKLPLFVFNWIAKAFVLNLPKDMFDDKSKLTGAEQMSLLDFNTWKTEHSGTFEPEFTTNIIPIQKLKNQKPRFNLKIGTVDISAYEGDVGGEPKVVLVLSEKSYAANVPHYVLSQEDSFKNINYKLIPKELFTRLAQLWKNNILGCDDIDIARLMVQTLSNIKVEKPQGIVIIN